MKTLKRQSGITPLVIILIAVGVLLVGGIYWWRQNQNIKTEAGWEIYTTTGYWGNKCSIKYPDNWEIKYEKLLNNLPYLTPKKKNVPEDIWVTINCFPKSKGYVSQSGKNLLPLCSTGKFTLSETEKFEGVLSKSFCIISADNSSIGTAMFQVRKGRQSMDYYIPDKEFEQEFNIFNQMLSTFKFISATSDPTVDWKGCVNTKYGYEVKYPPAWKIWKPGAPEARLATCDENLAMVAFSPNLFEYPISRIIQINIDVSNQERLRGTIYEGSKSIDDYFAKNPSILQNSPKVKETTIDGEKLVWLDGNWLLSFHSGSIFDFRINNVDDITLEKFIKTFKFTK